ncbi:MAG: ImmA/IrrE family metallo-endopeptidase [Oscillospiraceae bacterium]|nr:ImmA/IrrE family metallo-endopeptidase [Oscillospiraceae bacterium]MBR4346033.1 ImmA/IrrE family metallo-endopeptidase [Oscillospiraceae bacterium]
MRLSGNRYDEIEREVIKLFTKLMINRLPVDCYEICKQLGIEVVPYSMMSEKKRKMLTMASEDGCHALWEIDEGVYVIVIYYNDEMPGRRIRFTIMHELGHIILGHSEHSDLAESEANYFAKYALAPPPLVHKLKIDDYMELAEEFDISRECAYYAMQRYSKWLKYGSPELLEHEVTLLSLFSAVPDAAGRFVGGDAL